MGPLTLTASNAPDPYQNYMRALTGMNAVYDEKKDRKRAMADAILNNAYKQAMIDQMKAAEERQLLEAQTAQQEAANKAKQVEAAANAPKLRNVNPGDQVYNETTRQVEYTAPPKPDKADAPGWEAKGDYWWWNEPGKEPKRGARVTDPPRSTGGDGVPKFHPYTTVDDNGESVSDFWTPDPKTGFPLDRLGQPIQPRTTKAAPPEKAFTPAQAWDAYSEYTKVAEEKGLPPKSREEFSKDPVKFMSEMESAPEPRSWLSRHNPFSSDEPAPAATSSASGSGWVQVGSKAEGGEYGEVGGVKGYWKKV